MWAFTGTGGGYVEQAIASVEEILPLPANPSVADAVTLGGSGVVAHFGLRHAHFAPGETVLVRGAAGRIDVVAGQDLPSFFGRLNPNGRMVAVGAVAGRPPADFGTKITAAFQKLMWTRARSSAGSS